MMKSDKEKAVKISFVGDVFPGNLPYHLGIGIAGSFNKHDGQSWKNTIFERFKDSDFVIGNLESPLAYDSYAHINSFVGNNSFATFLKECGFSALSIANNHILEKGPEGFHSTINILNDNEIRVLGQNVGKSSSIQCFSKNEISFAVSSFNSIHDINNPGLYSEFSEESVMLALDEMKDVDFKILIFHWGNEYINIPSLEQIMLARKFVNAGADIIIGHHPHVIQPIINHKNGLIFFSLGNFLFDMTYAKNVRLGMCVDVNLYKSREKTYHISPVYLSDNYSPLNQKEKVLIESLKKYKDKMNSYLSRGEDYYKLKYEKEQKRKHLFQRILMKKDLIQSFYKLPLKEQIRVIKYIYKRIY